MLWLLYPMYQIGNFITLPTTTPPPHIFHLTHSPMALNPKQYQLDNWNTGPFNSLPHFNFNLLHLLIDSWVKRHYPDDECKPPQKTKPNSVSIDSHFIGHIPIDKKICVFVLAKFSHFNNLYFVLKLTFY